MSSKFIPYDRDTLYLMPPSIEDWLPEKHIARFITDILEELDFSALEEKYSNLGRKGYPVKVMAGLLFYGYATGVYSSRKIEAATYESVPFRYIAANLHPDHASISEFRRIFGKDLRTIFLQILLIASRSGLLKVANLSTDGSKINANASKHKALSWEYANKLEQQLKGEIDQLMKLSESADADLPQGMSIPEELGRKEARLKVIGAAKKEIEERAKKRFEEEQSEYNEKMNERKKHEEQTGKKKAGKVPQPPVAGPGKNDQVNLTDPESRIMPKSGGGFEQAYNAQASVDIESMLMVTNHVTQHTNDKNEIAPTVDQLKVVEQRIEQKCENLLADAGFFSEANVKHCKNANIAPLIANKRDHHNKSFMARFAEPDKIPENADSVDQMNHRLKTQEGKALYAKRKSTIEPVFGIIKNVMKFRKFLCRGLEKAQNEWNIVAIAWNIKRMYVLQA